jgi:putative ATP-dependent endonuclease of OLD family
MTISRIRIENFRCFKTFEMQPRKGLNLIVGGNNAGKTTLMQALGSALGRSFPTFQIEDFYSEERQPHAESVHPLRIDLEISPSVGGSGRFSDSFQTIMSDAIDFEPVSRGQRVIFRTEAGFDPTEDRIITKFYSLRNDGTTRLMTGRARQDLRSYFPFYLADPFRDVLSELRLRRGYWGRLIDSITVDADVSKDVQASLEGVNAKVRAGAPRLKDLERSFMEVSDVIPLADTGDGVVLNPVPPQLSEVLRNLEVMFRLRGGPRPFTLDRHGDGTRSVAYLAVFRAYVGYVAKEENDNTEAEPILGIEEPEVHLHPHATQGLSKLLHQTDYQSFITTHSPSVVQQAGASDIAVFRKTPSGIRPTRLPEALPSRPRPAGLAPEEMEQLDRNLSTNAADVVFGNSAMLFEGASEQWAIPVFARSLGLRLHASSISLVSVGGQNFAPFIKALSKDAFCIPWVVLSDAEEQTKRAIINALVEVGSVDESRVQTAIAADRLYEDVLLPMDCFTYQGSRDFEDAMLEQGALPDYQSVISSLCGPNALSRHIAAVSRSDSGARDLDQRGEVHHFMKHGPGSGLKPVITRSVVNLITVQGTDPRRIPPTIVQAIRRADAFACDTAEKLWTLQ